MKKQSSWDRFFQEGRDFSPLNIIFLDRLLETVADLQKKRGRKTSLRSVIDLGCGTGDSLVKFAQKGLRGIGVDFSGVALSKARDRLRKGKISGFEFRRADLDTLSLSEKADIIFSKLSYAFLKDKAKFLARVKKLMKSDSVFILMTPVLYRGITYIKEDQPGIAVNFKGTTKLLSKYFRGVEVFHHDYFGEKGDLVTFIAFP